MKNYELKILEEPLPFLLIGAIFLSLIVCIIIIVIPNSLSLNQFFILQLFTFSSWFVLSSNYVYTLEKKYNQENIKNKVSTE